MTYDAAGNLRDDGLAWHYRYDFENHLTHAEYPPGTTVGTFKYDALGRRIEADDAGEVRRYLYDGQQTIAGYGSTNALLRYFVHGATYIDEHALMRDLGLGQDRYYLLKELYTVAGLANSSGTVTDFYTYDAYGRLIEEPPPECTGLGELSAPGPGGESAGPAQPAGGPVVQGGPIGIDPSFECVAEPDPSNPEPPPPPADCQSGFGQFTLESGGGSTPPPDNPFYFTGQRLDRLGDCWRPMYDYRFRSYEPWHGRFLQRDPLNYVDSANLFEYVSSRPTRWLDPLGLQETGYTRSLDRQFADPELARKHAEASAALILLALGQDPNKFSPGDYAEVISREVYHLNRGSRLVNAALSRHGPAMLRAVDPDLAPALTPRARFELAVLGPAQGGAYVAEGVGDLAVDAANLAIDAHILGRIIDARIPHLRFPEGLFLETSKETACASRFLGGQAVLFLITEGFAALITVEGNSIRVIRAYRTDGLHVRGATGAFGEGFEVSGRGLGLLTGREVAVSERGLAIVERHLTRFDEVPENVMMVQRLRSALTEGRTVSGADASFYIHEVREATWMDRGIIYDIAHPAALERYGVSPYSVYHPEVIKHLPQSFNKFWEIFWGIIR